MMCLVVGCVDSDGPIDLQCISQAGESQAGGMQTDSGTRQTKHIIQGVRIACRGSLRLEQFELVYA